MVPNPIPPADPTQPFCSKSCAKHSQYPSGPRTSTRWGPRPPIDPEHRRLRAQLLPRTPRGGRKTIEVRVAGSTPDQDLRLEARQATEAEGKLVCIDDNVRLGDLALFGFRARHSSMVLCPATVAC